MKNITSLALCLAAAYSVPTSAAFADIRPGMFIRKDANADVLAAQAALAVLTKELGDMTGLMDANKTAMEKQYNELTVHYSGVKADNEELKAAVKKHADEYAAQVALHQQLQKSIDELKKEMDAPLLVGGKDLKDADTVAAIELQRRAFLHKGGNEFEFRPDMENLVSAADYRSAARKLMQVGLETKATIVRDFTAAERKAFDAASLDTAFFSPQLLGIEIDCNIECSEMVDLYQSVTVSKSKFMFPQVVDYGDIGSYQCDAACDAELGPQGNIKYLNGQTFDFRGVFCFQKKVLQEANYDFLGFMMRAAARSHRINRNRALITGNGNDEPLGWLTGDCFTKYSTLAGTFNHVDFRRFVAARPVEYGSVIATMHQNMFAYLSSGVDNNGRFLFGDGLMTFSPNDVRESIRISNCLPDATAGGTRGDTDNPFVAGDFLVAAGNWKMAYAAVEKRPLFMEQWMGQTTAWCVKYQFGAEDGGFVMCCPAAATLVVG